MPSLDAFARAKLADLDGRGLSRALAPTRRLAGPWVERGGRRLLSFSCNDYLGLTHHPAVIEAAVKAARDFGAGAGASRLVTGDHPLMAELEERLAALKGTQDACVFASGYAANIGTIPTLAGPGDLVVVDALAHACIWAGAQLSGAQVAAFAHNDMDSLRSVLAARRAAAGVCLIVTEGVFSMDGDLAPLLALSRLAEAYDAWLMTDDAHAVGVLADGRGSSAHFPQAKVDLQMGTLSKALASQGGYVCGSRAVIDLLKSRARSFVYSTGLAPSAAGAAIAAIDLMTADPALAAAPLQRARRFTRAANLPEASSAIVPVVMGDPGTALNAQARLEDEGFLVVAIRPPTVPVGTSRLRLTFTAGQPEEAIDQIAREVRKLAN